MVAIIVSHGFALGYIIAPLWGSCFSPHLFAKPVLRLSPISVSPERANTLQPRAKPWVFSATHH